MSRVALGRVRDLPVANWRFHPNERCDSVRGLSKDEGGALNVDEYAVYKTDQILPVYLLEVRDAY